MKLHKHSPQVESGPPTKKITQTQPDGQTDTETNEIADMQTHTAMEIKIFLQDSTAGRRSGSLLPTFVRHHESARGVERRV